MPGYLRLNNDVDTNIYNVFVQGRISPVASVQAEFRHREAEHGDLSFRFAPTEGQTLTMLNQRRIVDLDSYRLGLNVKPLPSSTFLSSLVYQDATFEIIDTEFDFVDTAQSNIAEVQYLYESPVIDLIVGGGYYDVDIDISVIPLIEGLQGDPPRIIATRHGNAYAYSYVRYPRNVTWIFGISYDTYDDDELGLLNSINPKFGILWNPTPDTTIRLGAYKTLKRNFAASQTLEPTNIAGFNQFFDDTDGAESTRYGIGIDHHFTAKVSGGFEISERDLDIPVALQPTILDREESLYRGYVTWVPSQRWAMDIEYLRDDYEDDNERLGSPLDTTTQIVPISISYFNPAGLFARFRVSYLDQEIGLQPNEDDEQAVIVDAGLGYRLPNRWGILEIQVQNLTDENFRFEGPQDRGPPPIFRVPSFSPFPPELTLFARFTLAL